MVDRLTVAKLMKAEKAKAKDEELIRAYEEVLKMLADDKLIHVTTCDVCKCWDKDSGLTARKCRYHDRITVQHDYCSNGRERMK